jgi:leucyl aminopeptidase (aminopeptidase T)
MQPTFWYEQLDTTPKPGRIAELMKAAMTAARWCLDIQPGETVLIVTDTEISPLIYYTLAGAIHTMGGIPVISLMRPLPYASAEPPTAVAEAMKSCDIIINCASRTITHSAARHEAQFRHGKRVLVMPAMTEDMLIRGAGAADFEVVKDITGKVVEFLGSGRSVRVTSKHGTDVTFSIDGRPAKPAHGQIRPPELLSVFPGGETPLCPVDGSVNGQIVIDSYMLDVGLVDRPIIWTVKQGQVVDIKPSRGCSDANIGSSGRRLFSLHWRVLCGHELRGAANR